MGYIHNYTFVTVIAGIPSNARGDGIKSTSIGATMKEIIFPMEKPLNYMALKLMS